jgi:ureidoglycolate hydrolase
MGLAELAKPVANGQDFGEDDLELTLNGESPRLWTMVAQYREPIVRTLARHQQCSQCFCSADGKPWWIALAPPSSSATPPAIEEIRLFWIEPGEILKLEAGTWHAGPYFQEAKQVFILLEMKDTNSHDFTKTTLKEPIEFTLNRD